MLNSLLDFRDVTISTQRKFMQFDPGLFSPTDYILPREKRRYQNLRKYDGQNHILYGADLQGATFAHADNFNNSASFCNNFTDCTMNNAFFKNSVLTGSNFSRAKLNNAVFNNSELSSLPENKLLDRLRSKFGDILFTLKSRIDKLPANSWDKVGYVYVSPATYSEELIRCTNFDNAELNGATFVNTSLRKVSFRNAKLNNADFSGADLDYADFSGAEIAGACFQNARMNGTSINLRDTKDPYVQIKKLKEIIKSGNASVEHAYMTLGEWLRDAGAGLIDIRNPITAKQLADLYRAKEDGKITELQLAKAFNQYSIEADEEDIPSLQQLPYIINKVHQKVL